MVNLTVLNLAGHELLTQQGLAFLSGLTKLECLDLTGEWWSLLFVLIVLALCATHFCGFAIVGCTASMASSSTSQQLLPERLVLAWHPNWVARLLCELQHTCMCCQPW